MCDADHSRNGVCDRDTTPITTAITTTTKRDDDDDDDDYDELRRRRSARAPATVITGYLCNAFRGGRFSSSRVFWKLLGLGRSFLEHLAVYGTSECFLWSQSHK